MPQQQGSRGVEGASISARRVMAVFAEVATGVLVGLTMTGPIRAASGPETAISFKEDVQPVLRERCVSCHSPNEEGTKASGLDLTNYASVMAGDQTRPHGHSG